MWTGSYRVPVNTITGGSCFHIFTHSPDIMQDIMLIDKVIGIAETAISDQRSNWPSQHELERIVSQARVAGMLSGKAGKGSHLQPLLNFSSSISCWNLFHWN